MPVESPPLYQIAARLQDACRAPLPGVEAHRRLVPTPLPPGWQPGVIPDGATAPEAAGKIHSDMERGFIRAEVAHWEEIIDAGSLAELKKRGRLRTEGKSYVVQDGDVLNILFNL